MQNVNLHDLHFFLYIFDSENKKISPPAEQFQNRSENKKL